MKPTAYLVNTSRGPIVDEAALVEALAAGRIAGADSTSSTRNRSPPDHPFRRLDNVIVTPHIGYVTRDCYDVFYRDVGRGHRRVHAWRRVCAS